MKNVKLIFAGILTLAFLSATSCNKEDDPTPNPPTPTPQQPVLDADGNSYQTIKIGNQVWMAENLRTTKYCNGDSIPNITDNTQWENLTTGAWAHYENDSQYENPYGKLYNWFTVNDARNICPCNWHVPTDAEWTVLTDYLGGDISSNIVGGKMKSTGTQYWQSPNELATNESGFSGLPGGSRSLSGGFGERGVSGNWWSSTEDNAYYAWYRRLSHYNGEASEWGGNKRRGFSVRCVKN